MKVGYNLQVFNGGVGTLLWNILEIFRVSNPNFDSDTEQKYFIYYKKSFSTDFNFNAYLYFYIIKYNVEGVQNVKWKIQRMTLFLKLKETEWLINLSWTYYFSYNCDNNVIYFARWMYIFFEKVDCIKKKSNILLENISFK